jgi:hypothetical protein
LSNSILNMVWPLKLDPMEKFILVALADRAHDDGVCWPSVDDLIERTCTSRRTVQRSISSLEDKGHVTRSKVPGKKCGYVIHPRQCDAPIDDDPRHSDAPPAPEGRTTRATQTPHPRHSDAQTISEPSIEPSIETSLSGGPNSERDLIVDAWNKMALKFGLPAVQELEPDQERALAKAMQKRTLDDWGEVLIAVTQSDFLLGRKADFQIDFDWLLKPGNFRKIRSGRYDNGPSGDGFSQHFSGKPTRTQARNQRRAMRSDFTPDQLVPEVDAQPAFADDIIPF